MIERIAKWFPWALLAPAVLPLVYIDGLLYPYLTPKTLLFRALFIVAGAAFAYLVLSGKKFYFARLKHWTALLPAGLLAVAYATSLISVDFYHSFWSIFDRGDGLLTLTAAIGFFYLILLHADKEFLKRLLSLAAWVGSLVALYAVLQWLQSASGMDIPLNAEPQGRLGGTLGNAAFLAAYLGMTFFASLAVLNEYRGRWYQALYVGTGLQLLAIFLAATRGTLLAMLLAGVVVAIYLSLRGEGRMRTYARRGLVSVVILAAVFIVFRGPLSEAPFEPVRRIASVSLEDTTVSSRLFVWQNVLGETLKQPLMGYGAEHVDILFNRVYDPSAIFEQWFDRSHNSYLDYFAQFGLLGVLLYMGIIALLAQLAWRLYKNGNRYGVFVALMTFVYAVQNFFVFDTAMTLWFLLAVFAAILAYNGSAESSASRFTLPSAVSLVAGIAILILLYPVALQPLRANLALAQGYLYHIVNVNRAVDDMKRGVALGTYADLEYGYQLYSMYTDRQQTMLQGTERVAAYQFALEVLMKNYERYPYDARTAIYLGHVLDSAPPEATVDEVFLREVLARAIELSPKRIQGWYLFANISLKKGDKLSGAARNQEYREAIEVLEEYSETVPEYAEPRYIIAGLYLVMGERNSAAEWAEQGRALYKGGDGNSAQRAIKYYIGIEDWENALFFMQDAVNEDSTDYEQVYDLAKLYFLNNNKEKALEIVERLRRDAPGLVETDPVFVRAIGQ